tara:strand:+ start:8621 stop:9349 length:729 start_codon:yes stop_codon:yes gene_type:complete
MNISIIGFGQMGQFMAQKLSKRNNVLVADPINKEKEAEKLNLEWTTIEEAAKNDIIFLFPPIDKIESLCKQIAPHLKPNSIVCDGCSVKVNPTKIMKDTLPNNIQIIGTHPLFGPQSGKNGIKGLTIVLCPITTDDITPILDLFKEIKLNIEVMTPEQHDKAMAETQCLELFLGKILNKMNLQDPTISTPGFDLLWKLKELLKEDSDELFTLIQKQNPFAENIRHKFMETTTKIEEALKNGA